MRRVLAFYQFIPLQDPEAECQSLQRLGDELGLRGTILVAQEGVNGTVVGETRALQNLAEHLSAQYAVQSQKWSDLQPGNSGFHRFKVRVKPEIVSFGVNDLDMSLTGEHVDAQKWNALIADPDVLVVDTRNDYEIDIGTFDRAVSPHTESFRQFPQWVAEHLDPDQHTKVAMFCTGGIRCEKASSYLLNQGFENVYQLDGGILQYLEDVDADESHWNGECFVFDQRVSVDAKLQQGQYKQCYACRHPLSAQELASPDFEHGVSCSYCIDKTSKQRRQQFRERQHQVRLAAQRGQQHIGQDQRKPKR
ncbi:MAG TPA: hypothetical protein DE147_03950 [Gammaproteobacteria bacterium]|nr:hypothetical protein [Gammaproteobacteria bacterium]HCG69585.1 hypothetical protein [Gammaproteobacteria bacterium]